MLLNGSVNDKPMYYRQVEHIKRVSEVSCIYK